MNIAGIIAEYDPFHNGHAHHIAATRAAGASHIIVVLGGNFTQRGEAALLSKADRTRLALAGGADLVIELPQPWAGASAEGFAYGGVALLHNMACVNTISFGSECGDIAILQNIAACMRTPAFTAALHTALRTGIPYAAALQTVVRQLLGADVAATLETPNNTLGLEYCKALSVLGSPITPFTVKREGAAHNAVAVTGDITSASHIRTLARAGKMDEMMTFVPPTTAKILKEAYAQGRMLTDIAVADKILLSHLRTLSKAEIAAAPGISEGLENRLFAAIRQQPSMEGILQAVKTKRYPITRLRRILPAALLGIPAGIEQQTPPYIRVRGMRDSGAVLLAEIQKNAGLPLFTDAMQPPADAFSKRIFDLECKASDLYGSMLATPTPCGQEFTAGMIKYREEI